VTAIQLLQINPLQLPRRAAGLGTAGRCSRNGDMVFQQQLLLLQVHQGLRRLL
jgi:hypothetical protein